jgi:hypothetical protein
MDGGPTLIHIHPIQLLHCEVETDCCNLLEKKKKKKQRGRGLDYLFIQIGWIYYIESEVYGDFLQRIPTCHM